MQLTATEILERWDQRNKEIADMIFPVKENPPEIQAILDKPAGTLTTDEVVMLCKNIMNDMAESYVRARAFEQAVQQLWGSK